MNNKEEFVDFMVNLDEFLQVPIHTTTEYVKKVKDLTGIELPKDLMNFYEAPASTKFHGAHPGGLVLHSLRVYYCALKLCGAFGLTPNDIDANACIFHDLVKVNLYEPLKIGSGYSYNKNVIALPHGSESLRRMNKLGIKLKSEAWEIAVAYHMGAFEPDNMTMYSNACEKYKEVLLLHTADMMATKIYKC